MARRCRRLGAGGDGGLNGVFAFTGFYGAILVWAARYVCPRPFRRLCEAVRRVKIDFVPGLLGGFYAVGFSSMCPQFFFVQPLFFFCAGFIYAHARTHAQWFCIYICSITDIDKIIRKKGFLFLVLFFFVGIANGQQAKQKQEVRRKPKKGGRHRGAWRKDAG